MLKIEVYLENLVTCNSNPNTPTPRTRTLPSCIMKPALTKAEFTKAARAKSSIQKLKQSEKIVSSLTSCNLQRLKKAAAVMFRQPDPKVR